MLDFVGFRGAIHNLLSAHGNSSLLFSLGGFNAPFLLTWSMPFWFWSLGPGRDNAEYLTEFMDSHNLIHSPSQSSIPFSI